MTRKELMDRCHGRVWEEIRRLGKINPRWVAVLNDGGVVTMPISSELLNDPDLKVRMVDLTAATMRQAGVTHYAFVGEGWMSSFAARPGESLKELQDRYLFEYRMLGMNAREAFGREEVVMIVTGDRTGTDVAMWKIQRKPDDADRVTGLVFRPGPVGRKYAGLYADLLLERNAAG